MSESCVCPCCKQPRLLVARGLCRFCYDAAHKRVYRKGVPWERAVIPPPVPLDRLRRTDIRVLGMIMAAQRLGVCVNFRGIMAALGLRSSNAIQRPLKRLRDRGLIGWVDRCHGTLHATCVYIPVDKL